MKDEPGPPHPAKAEARRLLEQHQQRGTAPTKASVPERDLLAELHEEQCAHGATLRQLDVALATLARYGQHQDLCARRRSTAFGCTCGLSVAVAASSHPEPLAAEAKE